MANFEAFLPGHFFKHKSLISEECELFLTNRSITKSEPYTSYSYYNVAKPIYTEKKNSRTQGLGTYTQVVN